MYSQLAYAQLLYWLSQHEFSAKIAIEKFFLFLKVNNDENRLAGIVNFFEHNYQALSGVAEVRVVSASKLDKETMTYVKKHLHQVVPDAKDITLQSEIDSGLLGGVKILYGDTLLDLTVKKQLTNLKNSLLNI